MQLLEIIKSLLNANRHAFAYANCRANANVDKKGKIMAFWQPSFDPGYPDWTRKSPAVKDVQPQQAIEKSQPSDVIRKARKLVKSITKVATETPESLAHYLSKEDIENLELLNQELTDALNEIAASCENNSSHDLKQ